MKLLLTGPPASGKSTVALQCFRAGPDSLLLTPTATMAEHLRHELARSGAAIRPNRVQTLSRLLSAWGSPPEPPAWLLRLLMEDALERLRPARFAKVLKSPGLHAELAKLIEEVPAPDGCGEELSAVFHDVASQVASRGLALRNQRLRIAAAKVLASGVAPPARVVFDGFFTLAAAELDFIEALSRRCEVAVTLPQGAPASSHLKAAGFEIQQFSAPRRAPERFVFSASAPEHEAEEIARRILDHAASGRKFREIAVLLRSREPYGPLIETTLARFGIPARAYFADPLATHPAVAYLAGLARSSIGGFDYAALNSLLRMPVSGAGATAAGDRLDFELREALPGHGLPIPGIEIPPQVLRALEPLAFWTREQREPADWAERLKALRRLVATPSLSLPQAADREQIFAARSTAAALDGFAGVLDQAARFSPSGRMSLERFWAHVETALAVEPLRADDRRRDVVHVMDVYEARQWELPVVFVCGLVERSFPLYHGENPVLGDSARRKLGLPASAELQAEERFLFDLAVSRATEQVTLSFARFDERGEETLPSFFLNGWSGSGAGAVQSVALRARPKPKIEVVQPVQGPVTLSAKPRNLSASSIDKFLQCPFQFFANKTLHLQKRPAAPRDRLNVLLQGNIIHEALADWPRTPLLAGAVLDRAFERACADHRVPRTYRTEAVRLELLRHFENFLADRQFDLGWESRVEEEFEFALSEALMIRGRIDRLEVGPQRQALVIDYKYSGQVRSRVQENEDGRGVQAGLYLLAAERALGLKPVGMLYCGLKGGIDWQGWRIALPGLDVGELCGAERIRELMDGAAQKAQETLEKILAGRVEVHPADRKKCAWCEYRDICRVETIAAEDRAGAAG